MTNKPKLCKFCGELYTPHKNSQRYCSKICKTRNNQVNGSMTCKRQYLRISGNWVKFFARLISFHQRQRDGLTKEDLLAILEKQHGRCALSGIELTCLLGEGKLKTNASVDRIDAGGPYVKENIQLVCSALNKFREATGNQEFIWWCKQVAAYHKD